MIRRCNVCLLSLIHPAPRCRRKSIGICPTRSQNLPSIQVFHTTLYLGSQHGICIPIGHAINFARHTRFLAAGCLCAGFPGGRTCLIFRKNDSALQSQRSISVWPDVNTMRGRIKNRGLPQFHHSMWPPNVDSHKKTLYLQKI
jgi:hypothetical protein